MSIHPATISCEVQLASLSVLATYQNRQRPTMRSQLLQVLSGVLEARQAVVQAVRRPIRIIQYGYPSTLYTLSEKLANQPVGGARLVTAVADGSKTHLLG